MSVQPRFKPESAPDSGAVLAHAAVRLGEAVYIDVVDRHHEVAAWLGAHGFAAQRRFTRMLYRHEEPFGDSRIAVAIAGPELG